MQHEFTAAFMFAGSGVGAVGFLEALARLGADRARFRAIGGVDNDPLGCADFEMLTGAPATLADVSAMTPAELRAAWGPTAPDAVFLSPPCKGFSRLLGRAAASAEKYQKLNRLVLEGIFLMCETWPRPPSLLVLENVPGIVSRGAELLDKVRKTLHAYGYLIHEATHDCGEVGGLAQHRRRYLLVARLPAAVSNYVYKPPRRRVRGCGEVLGELPLPADPDAGVLHELPRISLLNWMRLALIPPGGDWRDLPEGPFELRQTAAGADGFKGRPGLFGVNDWKQPLPTITGSASVSGSNAVAAVADPRVTTKHQPFGHANRVTRWDEPLGTVTASPAPSSGAGAIADPRALDKLTSPVPPGQAKRTVFARYHIAKWEEPARTVSGEGSNGGYGIADPRLPHSPYRGSFGVVGWGEPAPTVRGAANVRTGPTAVADPRLKCRPRPDAYGVLSWSDAAGAVTGSANIDNGRFAVADPRRDGAPIPVIVSPTDGAWHRPLTTLELAALQGLPAVWKGKPLQLAGSSSALWRERIGNAVPVGAGRAIAESLLIALLASKLGTWRLGGEGIWVRNDGYFDEPGVEA